MRVLHYYNWGFFEPISCGADVIASNQLEYFRRRGWDVDILLPADPGRAHQAGAFRERYSWVKSMQLVDIPNVEFSFSGQLLSHRRIAQSDCFRKLARE